jgi:hypothetical protein
MEVTYCNRQAKQEIARCRVTVADIVEGRKKALRTSECAPHYAQQLRLEGYPSRQVDRVVCTHSHAQPAGECRTPWDGDARHVDNG